MTGDAKYVVRVISANDIAARHLVQILRNDSGVEPESANASKPESHRNCHVFVIDAANPGRGLAALVRTLSTGHPNAKFVLVAPNDGNGELDPFFILFSGIHGVVFANDMESGLAATVTAVARGNCCFPAALLADRKRLDSLTDPDASPAFRLTPREKQVLALLQRRFSNREIADILGINETTVKGYVSTILSKLGVSSRRELSRPTGVEIKPPIGPLVAGAGDGS